MNMSRKAALVLHSVLSLGYVYFNHKNNRGIWFA